jgi:hypothetical protein
MGSRVGGQRRASRSRVSDGDGAGCGTGGQMEALGTGTAWAAGPKVGRWAAVAQGSRGDGGGGVGRRVKMGRRGYGGSSVALAEAPSTDERGSGDGGGPVTATVVLR